MKKNWSVAVGNYSREKQFKTLSAAIKFIKILSDDRKIELYEINENGAKLLFYGSVESYKYNIAKREIL